MAFRVVLPQNVEGNNNGGIKQKNAAEGQGRNRKALNDIGNPVTIRDVEGKLQRPITRSFGAKLLANAQAGGDNKIKKAAPGVAGKTVVVPVVPKPPTKRAVPTTKPKSVEVIEISPDTEDKKQEKPEKLVTQNERSVGYKKKKKVPSMTALLTARSKVYFWTNLLTFETLL